MPIEVGTQVRHVDGTLGTVTAIHDGKPGERLVEWKSCGKYRISGEAALTIAAKTAYRWR
jgi:hypothetical protein